MSILTLEELEHTPKEPPISHKPSNKTFYVAGFTALAILAFMVGLSLARIFGHPQASTTKASTIEPRGPAVQATRP